MITVSGASAGSPSQAQLAVVNVGRWVYSGTRKLSRVRSSARRQPSGSRALVTVSPGPRTDVSAALPGGRCSLVNKPMRTPPGQRAGSAASPAALVLRAHHPGGVAPAALLIRPAVARPAGQQRFPAA